MSGSWFVLQAGLRRRWRGYAVLVVLLAIGGGASLTALAGARRTMSAYPRYLRASKASNLLIDTGGGLYQETKPQVEQLYRLPGVVQGSSYVALNCGPLTTEGTPDFRFFDVECLGSVRGRFFDQDRVHITQGRLADPTRRDELVVNAGVADRHHLRVGQRLRLGFLSQDEVEALDPERPQRVAVAQAVTIVGIAKFNDEIVQDEIDRSSLFLLTPALLARRGDLGTYVWTGLRLRGGDAAVPATLAAYRRLPTKESDPVIKVAADTTRQTERSVRPQAVALALFGIAAGVGVVLLIGQALVRQVRISGDDQPALRAVGMDPAGIAAVAVAGTLAVVAIGVIGAVAVAVALSPLTPVGPVRAVEPHPGASFDALALGLGALVIAVLVFAQPLFAAWRGSRAGERSAPARPSRLVAGLLTLGAPAPAVVGSRLALEPGRGRTAVPVRTTLIGALAAVVAVVAALTWGSSLRSLVNEPRLYGWDWDTTLYSSGGYGPNDGDLDMAPLAGDRDVQGFSGVVFQSLRIDRVLIPVLGLQFGKGDVGPPVIAGRPVRGSDEIVLGPSTLARIGKHVGDQVEFGSGRRRQTLRVVGTAVFPTLGVVHGDRTSLGVGASVTRAAMQSALGPGENHPLGAVLVRFAPGVDRARANARLNGLSDRIDQSQSLEVLSGPRRPADIVNFRTMGAAPTLLAGLLGLMAIGTLANALVTSVRRRRRDLALFKALGFTRRQLSATVAWQATITMGIAVVLGVPVGIALGRAVWSAFARSVGVVPSTTVPVGTLALVGLGVLVIANLVAAGPARVAARTQAAGVLRAE